MAGAGGHVGLACSREGTAGWIPHSAPSPAPHHAQVPFSYVWSPAVVPKPADWPHWVDVVGYQFLDEAQLSAYQPPPALAAFLAAGPPPVYVGFGCAASIRGARV